MKIPNLLTASRIALAPLFLWLFMQQTTGALWWAFVLSLLFEVTDIVDGAVARKLKQTSQVGKILDPLADSVSRFTVFLAFLVEGYTSVWALLPIFYRDSFVSTIRILAASQGVIVSARASGKIKAIIQGVAINTIVFTAAAQPWTGMTASEVRGDVGAPLMWIVAGVTLWSLFDYFFGNREMLRRLDA